MKVNLILEGGGMRGVYTAGVLDFFMEKNIAFKDITAVSAGVAVALYYVSGQINKSLEIFSKYSTDKRYLSIKNLLKTGSAFGLDFIFKTIPNEYIPFDYNEFKNSDTNLIAVCTNLDTGKPHYELIDDIEGKLDYAIASASLPLVSRIVRVDDLELLDGGIADPIPIHWSYNQGFDYHVLVLTRNKGYRKNKRVSSKFLAAKYIRHRDFANVLLKRHSIYNKSLDFAEELESRGNALIIRPTNTLTIDRFEKDPEKLMSLYEMGYEDAKAKYLELINLCKDCDDFDYK